MPFGENRQAHLTQQEYGEANPLLRALQIVSAMLYQLRSVTPTDTPDDSEGTWFRYVIAQGDNEISGLRTGNAETVTSALNEMVEHLNLRSRGKNIKKLKPAATPAAPIPPAADTAVAKQP